MIELSELHVIMPRAPVATLEAYAPHMIAAMVEASIITVTRAAAFIAQIAHESGELRYMEEIADGSAYEGRVAIGNINPGDGKRYKGRGPIQLTGRANYRAAGEALDLDLEGQPEIAARPEVGFRTAAWFWSTHELNKLADTFNFRAITRAINGGYNGLEQRIAYYTRALEALGLDAKILGVGA